MKEISREEYEVLFKKYRSRSIELCSKRVNSGGPYFDGSASHFYAKVPATATKVPKCKPGYTVLFHFKLEPNCNIKPTGFITCCFEKGDKIYLTKHKAGNCPCWKKGYYDR